MKKIGIVLLVVVVLLVVAAAIIPSFVDVNRYRGGIEAQLEQRLGRDVTLGHMNLRVLPAPMVRVQNVSIADDKNFGGGAFAQAQELLVSVKLWPLLRKDIQVSSLELRRPRVELIRNQQGVWNFSSLAKKTQEPQPPAQQQPPQQQPPPQQQQAEAQQQAPFSLEQFQLTDGMVAITDQQKHQSRAVYDHIDVTLEDFAPGQPFSLNVAAHLPGEGKQTLQLDAKAGPINDATLLQTPIDGTLKLKEVALSGVQKFLNTEALANTDAIVSGNLDVKNSGGKLSSSGSLRLENARVRGVNVGYPITADYKVTDDLTQDVIQIEQGTIKLGATPVSLTGSVNTRPQPMQVNVRVTAKDASIEEAARLAAAFGVAFSQTAKISGRVNADVHAQGAANQPQLNGSLSARDLVITGQDIPQPVKVQAIDLALTPQQIRSNDFTASTGGTSLNGRLVLAQYTSPNPMVDAVLRTANAQIGELLNMARAYGMQAVDGMTGSGTLDLDVNAKGPVKNADAMVFSGTGRVQNASVKTPALTQPLNVKNANLRFTQNSAVLENLAASLGKTNATGSMTVRNFAAPQLQFMLNADVIDIAEIQNITAPASSQPPRKTAALNLVPTAHAQVPAQPSLLTKATGSGTLSVGQIINDQLVLNNVRSNVSLDRGIIRLAPVTAEVFGGQNNGTITLDARTTPMPVQMQMKLERVDANKLVSSMTSLKQTIYGLLAANSQLSFMATNSNDIARTLNGRMSLNLANGKIAGIDLMNQLASIGKFAGFNSGNQAVTNVVKLTGDFDVKNGLATTNNLQAQIEGGTLAANGSVNLADQSLAMKLTAVLSREFSQRVGGSNIGGFMNTALANKNGELVMPVIITGTFQKPQVAPDVQRIAEMKMQNLLPSLGNPGRLNTGILGNVLGGNKGQSGAAGAAGGLGGIVGAITGRQQRNGQQQQGEQPVAQPQQQAQPPQGQAQQQQQQPQANPLNQALESLLGGKKKKQDQQQQSPPK